MHPEGHFIYDQKRYPTPISGEVKFDVSITNISSVDVYTFFDNIGYPPSNDPKYPARNDVVDYFRSEDTVSACAISDFTLLGIATGYVEHTIEEGLHLEMTFLGIDLGKMDPENIHSLIETLVMRAARLGCKKVVYGVSEDQRDMAAHVLKDFYITREDRNEKDEPVVIFEREIQNP